MSISRCTFFQIYTVRFGLLVLRHVYCKTPTCFTVL